VDDAPGKDEDDGRGATLEWATRRGVIGGYAMASLSRLSLPPSHLLRQTTTCCFS
jgi:hypothetical protein